MRTDDDLVAGAPVRVRLTIRYTAVLALLLAIYATATFIAVRHEFREQLEEADALHGVDAEEHLDQQLSEILFVLAIGFPIVLLLARRGRIRVDAAGADADRSTVERSQTNNRGAFSTNG